MLYAVLRELWPVLAVLYLVDGVAWVRARHVLFAGRLARGFTVKEPGLRLAGLLPGETSFSALRPPDLQDPESWTPSGLSFDVVALGERRALWQRETRWLRPASLAFFFLVFAAMPAVLYLVPPPSPWLAPLLAVTGVVYGTVLGLATLAARAGAALRRRGISPPSGFLVSMIFSPPAAARAASSLARDLFQDFDPLAVAAVLLPRDELLRRVRAELHGAACAPEDLQGFWIARSAALRGMLDVLKIPREALAPPPKRDPEAESWCPVCDVEYRAGFAVCDDCSLPLVPF